MALSVIPGVGEGVMAAQMAAEGAQTVVGEENYSTARSAGPWLYAGAVGFVPLLNPIFLPIQIAMFIFFFLIFAFYFDFSWSGALASGWVTQAVIVMFAYHWMIEKVLTYGVGI